MPIFKQGASYVCSDECATIARAIEDKGYDSCLAKNGIRVPTLEQIKALPNAPRK